MRGVAPILCLLIVLPVAAVPAQAQNVTVQQPTVSNFSATTTVSVPDRGAAFIGGLGGAASGRSRFGPFPSGSSVGTLRSGSSISTHVYIHDLGEMDRAVLNSAPASPHVGGRLSGPAAHAYRHLSSERGGSVTESSPPAGSLPFATAASPEDDGEARALRSLSLGRDAEQRGDLGIARLHYRLAAKYGSTAAAKKLESLDTAATVAGPTR